MHGLGDGLNISASIDAWHSYAVLGLLLMFIAIGIWAVQRFTAVTLPTWQVEWSVATPALAAIGTVLVAIRAIAYTGHGIGLRYGAFLLVISGVVFVVLTYDRSDTVARAQS